MIPESEWVWQGHPAHLIVSDSCRFRMATRVGAFVVSTVGEYYVGDEKRTIGGGVDDFFETMVFDWSGNVMDCGCSEVDSFSELTCERYADPKSATEGHMAMCRKYAGMEAA